MCYVSLMCMKIRYIANYYQNGKESPNHLLELDDMGCKDGFIEIREL